MKRALHRLTFALFAAFVTLATAPASAAPPRFGIEGAVGQSIGLTPYIDNARYVADDDVFLVDEVADAGLELSLRFVFDNLTAGAGLHFFDRQRVTLHHVGDQPLPDNRVRPDGSIDDSGIVYESIDRQTVTVPDSSRGSLFALTVEGAYRWYFAEAGPVDFYLPISGGLVMTHVQEDQREYEFGATLGVGAGSSVKIAEPISLFVIGKVSGLITPTYGDQSDANRAEISTGGSTPEALFSTMIFVSITAGLQFAVR